MLQNNIDKNISAPVFSEVLYEKIIVCVAWKKYLPISHTFYSTCTERRVWRYQRGNQKPYIEEEQTTQWPKEKLQQDKQQSTKHNKMYGILEGTFFKQHIQLFFHKICSYMLCINTVLIIYSAFQTSYIFNWALF
jgi:hypothetical protein